MLWLPRLLGQRSYRWRIRRIIPPLFVALHTLMLLLFPQHIAAQSSLPATDAISDAAVPCLAAPAYAVARNDDTIFAPRSGLPAVLRVAPSEQRDLAPLGQRPSHSSASARVPDGIGAVYGLAYDDGAVTGLSRIYAAAHLRRFTAFGPGGPGAIYAIDPATGAWSHLATVPGEHWDRTGNDRYDADARTQVGRSGLGGLAMHPEGRHLFIVNITLRRIDILDLTTNAFLTPISLSDAYAAIGQSSSDTYPFAITFAPQPVNDAPVMLVGFTNSATATVFVAAFSRTPAGIWSWSQFLAQDLRHSAMLTRLDGATAADVIGNGVVQDARAWNPWVDHEGGMARTRASPRFVVHPQPILTDLTFAPDGQTLFLGIRDRTGDQLFFRNPPDGGYSAIAQGDLLTYRRNGNGWRLAAVSRTDRVSRSGQATIAAHTADVFNDNLHAFSEGDRPAHIENHMGSLATLPVQQRADPAQFQVASAHLLGALQAGVVFYAGNGSDETGHQNVMGGATPTKVAALGDVEPLCTYAYVQGVVWEDVNRDGIRQDGEPLLRRVRVELADAHGSVLAAVTTDAQGRYRFAAPPNRDMRIRIDPAAFTANSSPLRGYTYTLLNSTGDLSRDNDASREGIILTGIRSALASASPHEREASRLHRQEDRRALDLGVAPSLDLDIALTGPAQVGAASSFQYTVRLRNLDNATAEQVVVSLRLPAGVTFVGSEGAVFDTATRTASWNLGSVAPATIRSFTVNVRAPDVVPPQWITASATVTTATPERNTDNNTAFVTTRVDAPDLAVSIGGPSRVVAGSTFVYQIQVRNLRTETLAQAEQVILSLRLPAGMIFVSGAGAQFDAGAATVRWELGTLAPGAERSFTVYLQAPPSVPDPTAPPSYTGEARVSGSTPEWSLANNTASITTQVVAPDLTLSKSAPSETLVGDELTYTLTIGNRGATTAWNVGLTDQLPLGVVFIGADHTSCNADPATRTVRCTNLGNLDPSASLALRITVRSTVEAPDTLVNTATVTTTTPGDPSDNNTSSATTRVLFPDPAISVALDPSPLPVGETGTVIATIENQGTGTARAAEVEVTLDSGAADVMPSGSCTAHRLTLVRCAVGDLPVGGRMTIRIPVRLPATPVDATTFPHDTFGVRATVRTATPERSAALANNTDATTANVVRPNVFVTARGPAEVIGWGSIYAYEVTYGNLYHRRPDLTRAAANVVLRVTLPSDATFRRASVSPSRVNGSVLEWELGTLAARFQASQPLMIVVQTSVPAGVTLRMVADIRTATPGDDPSDNRTVVDVAVAPPPTIEQGRARIRLAINSEFDPLTGGTNPTDAVYLTEGVQFAWPAGETLRYTPRLTELRFPNDWDPLLIFPHYEYRARITGWRVTGYRDERGVWHDPRVGGGAGCVRSPQGLPGCLHAYLGGENLDAIRSPRPVREDEIANQAQVYWSHRPLPPSGGRRGHVYGLERIAPVGIRVAVDAEVWIVNTNPDPGDLWDGELPEIPVAPLPPPQSQVYEETFTVNLVAPRSLVGPGSVSR